MALPQRRALGTLFLVLAIFFAGIAITAGWAGGSAWVIAFAAAVLALWLTSVAVSSLKARR